MTEFRPDGDATETAGEPSPRPALEAGRARPDVGTALRRSVSLAFGRLQVYGIVTVVALAPLFLLNRSGWAIRPPIHDPLEDPFRTSEDFMREHVVFGFLDMAARSVVHATLLSVGAAAMAWYVFRDARGERCTLPQALERMHDRLFPILGASLLMGLAVGVGNVLLCIPGAMLRTIWFVAIPVMVIERRGVLSALGRSFSLVRPVLWHLFALCMLLLVVQGVGSWSIQELLIRVVPEAGSRRLVAEIAWWLLIAGTAVVLLVAQSVFYVALRENAEGLEPDRLDDVFA